MTTKLIKDETKLFQWIDNDFTNWNVDESVENKKRELIKIIPTSDFTFKEVFKEEDALNQKEVIDYVKKNLKEIKKFTHFFLLRNTQNEFFVASVRVDSDGLHVRVFRFEDDFVWNAKYAHRVVVPQLKTLPLKEKTLEPLDSLTLENAIKVVKENGYKIYKEI